MTVNERIKLLRQELNLSQAKFAKAISISNGYIAGIELGNRSVNDRIIKLISTEFNVREEWLRDGLEPKSNASDTFSLDEYAQQKGLSQLEFDIIKGYMELDKDLRKGLMSHFKSIFNKHQDIEIEDKTSPTDPTEKSVEQLEEEYKKMYSENVSKQGVSVSSGIEEGISKVI